MSKAYYSTTSNDKIEKHLEQLENIDLVTTKEKAALKLLMEIGYKFSYWNTGETFGFDIKHSKKIAGQD